MLTLQQFASAIGATVLRAEPWHDAFELAMVEREINTPQRISAFLGQVGHESASLTRLEENLNYSAQRLMQVWPSRFAAFDRAYAFQHNPEKLANEVYASRMGNGDAASGDGWRFHGRGPIQLTGRTTYSRCGTALDLPLVTEPERLLTDLRAAARSAAWFWDDRSCSDAADRGDIEAITRRINGGTLGLDDRIARTNAALRALA